MIGLEPLEFGSENASFTVVQDVVPTTQVKGYDDVLVEGTAMDMLKKVKCIYNYDDEVTAKLRRNLESKVLKRKKGGFLVLLVSWLLRGYGFVCFVESRRSMWHGYCISCQWRGRGVGVKWWWRLSWSSASDVND
ncbi:hypothetical protein V6N13_072377 [Hibiscus sabdariffa]|uniref:Uncharacterized protein n=1 Tax=Hibiscus sabdariffa TaxID=183260 RepID=A0ABR2R7S9_9ROSI